MKAEQGQQGLKNDYSIVDHLQISQVVYSDKKNMLERLGSKKNDGEIVVLITLDRGSY